MYQDIVGYSGLQCNNSSTGSMVCNGRFDTFNGFQSLLYACFAVRAHHAFYF